MNFQTLRERVLSASERAFPLILGVAFAFSNIWRFYWVGIGAILFSAVWFAVWNFQGVIKSRWAILVLLFFLAITMKDGILWVAGSGRFTAFAKSGSRVVSLFGAAALLTAYPAQKAERFFGIALGISALIISIATAMIHFGLLQIDEMNPNTFGMLSVWVVFFIVVKLRSNKKIFTEILAGLAGLAGLGLFYLEGFKNTGNRTAIFAYVAALVYLYLANPVWPSRPGNRTSRYLLVLEVAGAAAAITILSIVYIPRVDAILTMRQQLWMGYAQKAAERPLLGWGYTAEAENRAILDTTFRGKPVYEVYKAMGLGPHNSLLSMFFENGIIFALGFVWLLIARAWKTENRAGLFDVSLVAYIAFMSADAMAPGGISFLGFYLGVCILSPIAGTSLGPARKIK
jgi:O-antigen ligase